MLSQVAPAGPRLSGCRGGESSTPAAHRGRASRLGQRLPARLAVSAALATWLISFGITTASAHDPSAWGGLYRSRDDGASWTIVSEGRYVTAALDLAVHPHDPALLLLATDSGLLRSSNGGRDWTRTGGSTLPGLVLRVSFAADGRRAIAGTLENIAVSDDRGETWRSADLPSVASRPSSIVVSDAGAYIYLMTRRAAYRSVDQGGSWTAIDQDLPTGVFQSLLVPPGSTDGQRLDIQIDRQLFRSSDAGASWRAIDPILPPAAVVIGADPHSGGGLWAAGGGVIYRSDDEGLTWRSSGVFDSGDTQVRGIAVAPDDEDTLTLSTDRGLLRSRDGGSSWETLTYNLPAHLETGPLVRDPTDPHTLYVGYSIMPYDALIDAAGNGSGTFARIGTNNLIGAAAFFLLLIVGSGVLLRWLARYYVDADRLLPEIARPMSLGETSRRA